MISEGQPVLLYLDGRRNWIVRAQSGKEFHTHKGIVKLEGLIGKPYGSTVSTELGQLLYAFKPTARDYVVRMRRPTQILYEKDIALALFELGVHCGSRVIETGTGSGAMTAALADAVSPDGHVYTYEIRSDLLEIASRNISRLGLEKFVTVWNRDAKDGFEEKDVDAVFLDLSEPWDILDSAYASLKPGSPLASFSPTINQVERTVTELRRRRFAAIRTIESLVRDMRVSEGKTRPASLMVGHTGYLTFARKAVD